MIESAPISPTRLTYDEAWLYCLTLEHNGHHDWRMPSYDERINLGCCFGTWDMNRLWQYKGEKEKLRVAPVRDNYEMV